MGAAIVSRKIARAVGAVALVATTFAAAGCQKEERGEPLGGARADGAIPIGARSALDEGNAFYRSGQFDAALASYRQAVEAAPGQAAPWYGVYMAATALGDKQLADSAMARIDAFGPGEGTLSDSAMRDVHTGGGAGALMPPGHPAPGAALPKGHPAPGSGGAP
jgi:hypothetical protein